MGKYVHVCRIPIPSMLVVMYTIINVCMPTFAHNVQNNGKVMEWCHIQELYHKITSTAISSNGITLVPKLKQEHISLTSYSRMRVDLAAQVSCIF